MTLVSRAAAVLRKRDVIAMNGPIRGIEVDFADDAEADALAGTRRPGVLIAVDMR